MELQVTVYLLCTPEFLKIFKIVDIVIIVVMVLLCPSWQIISPGALVILK